MARKAVENSAIMLVVAIIIALIITMILLKGGTFVNEKQGTLIGIGQSFFSGNKGAFGQACKEWQRASESQQRDPGFILGDPPNPASIPGAAGAYGNRFACCRGHFESTARDFKSKGVNFNPQPDAAVKPYDTHPNQWNLWKACYDSCGGFINVYDACAQEHPGGEGDKDFIQCLDERTVNSGCTDGPL